LDIVSLPSLLAIPNSFGAPPSALQPGEIVDAVVVALLDNGQARLQLPDGIVDVRTAVPLTVGAKVRLAVNSTSAGLQLVVLTDANGSGRATAIPAALVTRLSAADGQPRAGADAAGAASASFEASAVEIAVSGGAGVPPPPQTASPSLSPAAAEALATAVQVAAARQGGLAPLLADLEQAATGAPALPAAVADAAARVLGLRVPLDANLSAADVRQALARSGLFLEARLAMPAPMPDATGAMDLKAALLVLRQIVKSWSDGEGAAPAGLPRPAAAPGPPPPYRGAPPAAQPASPPSLSPDTPPPIAAQRLLAETDAALARRTLLQVASLPDTGKAGSPPELQRSTQWAFEIPFATGQASAIAQFEITRDGQGTAAEGRAVWRVRFSLDVEPMGPVHALIAVLGDRAAVTLWVEREASAARLRESTGLLADALRGAELEPGDIQLRVGAPAAPRPAAGRFLDRAS
jgi:hypothetical protein